MTNKVLNLIQELNILNSVTITFANIDFAQILKNKKITELAIDLHPYKGILNLYAGDGNNKFLIKAIGQIDPSLVKLVIKEKITLDKLALQIGDRLKAIIKSENIVIPDNILFHLTVEEHSVLLNNYNKSIPVQSLPFILREIKLNAIDGTQLGKTKLGGKPFWLQNPETPKCPECNIQMSLVAQIDSFDDNWERLRGDNRYYFNDDGILYVFFPYCKCGSDPKLVFQSF